MKKSKQQRADVPVRVAVTIAENVTEEERRRAAWVFDHLADQVIERWAAAAERGAQRVEKQSVEISE